MTKAIKPHSSKNTAVRSQFVTTTQFNTGMEKLAQNIIRDISDLFYKKFEDNDKRWEKTDNKLENMSITQDKILKELVDMRDENDASTLHFDRTDATLKEHAKRITTLESAKN